MANISLVDATKGVSPVGLNNLNQGVPNSLAADCTAGAVLRLDPTTGKLTPANGDTAPHARVYGLALRAQKAGYGITVLRSGLLAGWNFDALDFDDPVYLSDTAGGLLADTAGTVTVVIGHIVPAQSTPLGVGYDKILELLPVYYA